MFVIFELRQNKHKKKIYADGEGNYFYSPQDLKFQWLVDSVDTRSLL